MDTEHDLDIPLRPPPGARQIAGEPMPKSTQPPKSFSFRGVKFRLWESPLAFYEHEHIADIELTLEWKDGRWCCRINIAVEGDWAQGAADREDPKQALSAACGDVERYAKTEVRAKTKAMAAARRRAKARAWKP